MRIIVVRRVVAGVVATLAVTAAGVATRAEPAPSTVTGIFTDASPLVVGSMVRASGVKVGEVSAITLENGRARVDLALDPAVLPLHDDATLKIRPVNLLGEQYVELNAGSPSAPLVTGPVVIPEERVDASVDFQELVDGLGDPTATSLAALVTTLGEGFDGSGAEAAELLRNLGPAFTDATELAELVESQNATLNQLVDRVEPVAAALAAENGTSMDRLVGSTEQALRTVAANRQATEETLAELPDTLASAERTLRTLATTGDAAADTLAAVRPVTDDLADITGELDRFADAADPALASLPEVLDKAQALIDEAGPVVAQLRAAGPDLRDVGRGARPLGDELLDQHLDGVLDFVVLWAMSTNGEDGLGHYFRGVAVATPDTLTDLAKGTVLPNRGGNGLPADPLQDVPGPDAVPDVLTPAPGTAPTEPPIEPPADPGATGLTEQQEQSMLGQLLGGS